MIRPSRQQNLLIASHEQILLNDPDPAHFIAFELAGSEALVAAVRQHKAVDRVSEEGTILVPLMLPHIGTRHAIGKTTAEAALQTAQKYSKYLETGQTNLTGSALHIIDAARPNSQGGHFNLGILFGAEAQRVIEDGIFSVANVFVRRGISKNVRTSYRRAKISSHTTKADATNLKELLGDFDPQAMSLLPAKVYKVPKALLRTPNR